MSNTTTDVNSNFIGVPPTTNVIVATVTLDIAGNSSHKVLVTAQFSADCSGGTDGIVVASILVDGNTSLNTQVNNLKGDVGTLLSLSGVVSLTPGKHQLDLSAFASNLKSASVHHRSLSVVDLDANIDNDDCVIDIQDLAGGSNGNGFTQANIDSLGTTTARTLAISNIQNVAAKVTVPSNVTLWFICTGQLSINVNAKLTINGPIIAPERQIFSGAGSIAAPKISHFWVRWFGAKGDDVTDDTIAIQKALATAQQSFVNPNVILGAGIFKVTSTLAYGAPNYGFSFIGVPFSSLQQGSADSVSIIRWRGGAAPVMTVDGFTTIIGMAIQNFGSATVGVNLNSAERLNMYMVSFVPPENSFPFSEAAVKFNSFDYASIDRCEFSSSPCIKITGGGTRLTITRCVFDSAGIDPTILADCSAELISFRDCTFNSEFDLGLKLNTTVFWDNSKSANPIYVLDISHNEFDSNGGGVGGSVIKANNVTSLRFHYNAIEQFGNLTDSFITASNCRVSLKGNWGHSINKPLVKTDTSSLVYVEENVIGPNSTNIILDNSSQSGMYIPVIVGAEFAGVANLHGELASPMSDAVYAITATDPKSFEVSFSHWTDTKPGYMTKGQRFTVLIRNASGGKMGTVTFTNDFITAGLFTTPENGYSRAITFVFDGTNAIELYRS